MKILENRYGLRLRDEQAFIANNCLSGLKCDAREPHENAFTEKRISLEI
jgi:hypothetical protein